MGRRRGRTLEIALLDAAWAELLDRGYSGFTLDAVAKRAATSTPVIYRRWTDKVRLAQAAISHASDLGAVDVPDTGSLRGDLIAIMRAANESRMNLLAATTVLLGGYFDESGTSPAKLREQILDGRLSMADTIMHRAIARGEVCGHVVSPRLISLPFDLFRHEILTTLRPVPDSVIVEIVDEIFLPLATRSREIAHDNAAETNAGRPDNRRDECPSSEV